ncbi:ankyrin repeats (3 copies) domain-containing protein [Ditylenchus destructor]|uniref:Ankyrin repeats (3 copies) domain-containing protein n=1 Tax=Ditylenchus destructor TaxID=166010 RepID=A0AAD4MMB9_9BILA|nr:ankyrin repeats (3 copies) domain-containing protein [Ditylenchus destructor]
MLLAWVAQIFSVPYCRACGPHSTAPCLAKRREAGRSLLFVRETKISIPPLKPKEHPGVKISTELLLAAEELGKAKTPADQEQQWNKMLDLVNEGANIDIEDDEHRSPLSYACEYSKAKVVEELIKVGVDHRVSKRIAKGEKGDKEQMIKTEAKILVDQRGDERHYRTVHRHLPIYYAVIKGDKDIFNVLVKNGANPKNEKTLLHLAAVKCHKDIARILVNEPYRFDINGIDSLGYTPLHNAGINNCDQVFMVILILKGANVNAINSYGETPLHMAAGYGKDIALKALIELGANLEGKEIQIKNDKFPNKITPLELAQNAKRTSTVKLLRDAIEAKKSGNADAAAHSDTTTAHANEAQSKAAPAMAGKGSKR